MSTVLPNESLDMIYKTLIEPHIRYCSVVWGNCGEALKDKLQNLQYRVAKIITRTPLDHVDHSALLKNLQWLSVCDIIEYEVGTYMFTALNHLISQQISERFLPLNLQHSHQTRSLTKGNLYIPPNQRNNILQHSQNRPTGERWLKF